MLSLISCYVVIAFLNLLLKDKLGFKTTQMKQLNLKHYPEKKFCYARLSQWIFQDACCLLFCQKFNGSTKNKYFKRNLIDKNDISDVRSITCNAASNNLVQILTTVAVPDGCHMLKLQLGRYWLNIQFWMMKIILLLVGNKQ